MEKQQFSESLECDRKGTIPRKEKQSWKTMKSEIGIPLQQEKVVKENGKRRKNSRPMPKASVRVLDAAYADRMPRVPTICIHG